MIQYRHISKNIEAMNMADELDNPYLQTYYCVHGAKTSPPQHLAVLASPLPFSARRVMVLLPAARLPGLITPFIQMHRANHNVHTDIVWRAFSAHLARFARPRHKHFRAASRGAGGAISIQNGAPPRAAKWRGRGATGAPLSPAGNDGGISGAPLQSGAASERCYANIGLM